VGGQANTALTRLPLWLILKTNNIEKINNHMEFYSDKCCIVRTDFYGDID